MNWKHIQGLALRHLYPLKRDFDLLSDMLYWPLVDTIVWGVTSQWIGDTSGVAQAAVGILMGLVLWNIIWRSQSEVSRNLMDEVWNNNLVNIFATSLTVPEWIVSVLSLSFLKMIITMSVLIPAIYLLYAVNVFTIGWWLLVFFVGTTLTGWWIGFIAAGIVIRYGQRMQTVIWTLPGILLPFSAVFFPLERLPIFMQPISRLVPTTYLFETMRSVVNGAGARPDYLVISFGLNILLLVLAIWFFVRSFAKSRELGLGRFNA